MDKREAQKRKALLVMAALKRLHYRGQAQIIASRKVLSLMRRNPKLSPFQAAKEVAFGTGTMLKNAVAKSAQSRTSTSSRFIPKRRARFR